jgi:hypothetical protein
MKDNRLKFNNNHLSINLNIELSNSMILRLLFNGRLKINILSEIERIERNIEMTKGLLFLSTKINKLFLKPRHLKK